MIVVVAEPPAQPLASAEERVGRHALRMFPHRLHEVTEWGAPEMRHKPHDLMWTFQRFGLKVLRLENLAFYHLLPLKSRNWLIWIETLHACLHSVGWYGLKLTWFFFFMFFFLRRHALNFVEQVGSGKPGYQMAGFLPNFLPYISIRIQADPCLPAQRALYIHKNSGGSLPTSSA